MPLSPLLERLRPLSYKEWAKGLFTRNLPMKSVSLVLALMLWAFVQQGQKVEQTLFAEVAYQWPDDLVVAKPPPSRVRMTLTGSRARMRRIDRESMKVVVDMSAATEGDQTIDYSRGGIEGLPSGVQVLETRPSSARLALEQRVSRKLPVFVNSVGELGEGLSLKGVVAEPAEVMVYGPASVVEQSVRVSTEQLSLVEIKGEGESVFKRIRVKFNGPANVQTEPRQIQVRVTVERDALGVEQRLIENVPVLVQGDNWTTASTHAKVALSGPSDVVKDLDQDQLFVVLRAPTGVAKGVNSVLVQGDETAEYRYMVTRPSGVDVVTVEPADFELVRRN